MKRTPDALISDFRLANQATGMDVMSLLKQNFERPIPTLIVTGDTDKENLKILKENKLQVLHKPVPAAKLRAFLRSVQSQRK